MTDNKDAARVPDPKQVDRRKGADHKHGNIETDTPGQQQSLDDINSAVEQLIEQEDDDKKKS